MRTGIYTGTKTKYGDGNFQMLREAGFDAVDLRLTGYESLPSEIPFDEIEPEIRRQKALADEAGIEVFQMHGPWVWPLPDGENVDLRIKNTVCYMRAAAILDCRYVVAHPVMPFGRDQENGNEQGTWDANRRFIDGVLKTAQELNVTVCMENLPFRHFSMSLSEDIYRFVKEIGDPHVKICFDTGHSSKMDPVPVPDALRLCGDEVSVLHVHDNNGKEDQHLIPYYGVIDWAEFGKALKDTGFQGVLNLEAGNPHGSITPEAAMQVYRALSAIARSIAVNSQSNSHSEESG